MLHTEASSQSPKAIPLRPIVVCAGINTESGGRIMCNEIQRTLNLNAMVIALGLLEAEVGQS
jgi:hypothetical protein